MTDTSHAAASRTMTPPDNIWFAHWNGLKNTSDQASYPAFPNSDWNDHQRLHQYDGNLNQAWVDRPQHRRRLGRRRVWQAPRPWEPPPPTPVGSSATTRYTPYKGSPCSRVHGDRQWSFFSGRSRSPPMVTSSPGRGLPWLGSRSYKRSRPTASPTASCGIDSRPGTTPGRLPRAHPGAGFQRCGGQGPATRSSNVTHRRSRFDQTWPPSRLFSEAPSWRRPV